MKRSMVFFGVGAKWNYLKKKKKVKHASYLGRQNQGGGAGGCIYGVGSERMELSQYYDTFTFSL